MVGSVPSANANASSSQRTPERSSSTTASSRASIGGSDQASGGETFAPSVPKRSGRRPRSANAGLVSRNCTATSGVSGCASAAGSNHSDMS